MEAAGDERLSDAAANVQDASILAVTRQRPAAVGRIEGNGEFPNVICNRGVMRSWFPVQLYAVVPLSRAAGRDPQRRREPTGR
jgi:hypothetical protein